MSQKSRELERRERVNAVRQERDRCALHVRAMIGILKRGAGQPEPWSRLEQALEHIQRGDPVTETIRDFALRNEYRDLPIPREL